MPNDLATKKILFIQDEAIRLGGSKILVSTLCEALVDKGISVDVLLKTNLASSSALKPMPPEVRLIFYDPSRSRSWRFPFGIGHGIEKLAKAYDQIISLSPQGAFFAYLLKEFYGISGNHLFYVINNIPFPDLFNKSLVDEVLLSMPDTEFAFMNIECKLGLERGIGRKFSSPAIIPLPVRSRRPVSYRESKTKRIVSIGRIEPVMKTYNWNAIKPIVELAKEGIRFEWHIYGSGTPASVAHQKSQILDQGAGGLIQLHGEVPYEQLESILTDAYAFLGMGTALVEAASLGTPAIAATAYSEEPLANGYFHDLPFGNIGEPSDAIPPTQTFDLIRDVLTLNEREYLELREKSVTAAQKYSSDSISSEIISPNPSIENTSHPKCRLQIYARYLLCRIQHKLKSRRTTTNTN